MTKKENYIVPEIEVIEVDIEKGFAQSGGIDGQWFGDETDWN